MSSEPERCAASSTVVHAKAPHVLVAFPHFRSLFLARLVSAIGDRFFSIALAWWVVSRDAAHERMQLGILMAINMLPVVLFGPLLGTLVDRLDKKACMVAADAARALFVGTLAFLLYQGTLTLPVLYVLCFLSSACSPLFDAAAATSLVQLTDEEHLPRAVATDSFVIEISGIAGALVGSVLLLAWGVEGAFLFNALSFALSLVLVLRIGKQLPGEATANRYVHELREGFRYLRSQPRLTLLLSVFAALNFFASPLLLIIPLVVKDVLRSGGEWVAWLQLAFGLGSAVTVGIFSFRKGFRSVYFLMFAATLAMGLALLALAFSGHPAPILTTLFVSGMGVAAVNALALSLFQESVPYELKGRFFALLNTVCFAVMPLTFLVNGALAESLPLSLLIALNGAGTVLLSLVILALPRLKDEVGKPQSE